MANLIAANHHCWCAAVVAVAMASALGCSKSSSETDVMAVQVGSHQAEPAQEIPEAQRSPCSLVGFGSSLSWSPDLPSRLIVGVSRATCADVPKSVLYSFDLTRRLDPKELELDSRAGQILGSSLALDASPKSDFPALCLHYVGPRDASSEIALVRDGTRAGGVFLGDTNDAMHTQYCTYAVGDVDDDGHPDISVATTSVIGERWRGSVHVRSGLDCKELFAIPSASEGEWPHYVLASAHAASETARPEFSIFSLWSTRDGRVLLRQSDREGAVQPDIVVCDVRAAEVAATLVRRNGAVVGVAVTVSEATKYVGHLFLVSVDTGKVDLLLKRETQRIGGPVHLFDANGGSIVVAVEGSASDELIKVDVDTRTIAAALSVHGAKDYVSLMSKVMCAVGDVDGDGCGDVAVSDFRDSAPFREATKVSLLSGLHLSVLRELSCPQD